jgi:hypothetical protein
MTFNEVRALPNTTAVHLANGWSGVVVVWQEAKQTVRVAVPSRPELVTIACARLARDASGGVVETVSRSR